MTYIPPTLQEIRDQIDSIFESKNIKTNNYILKQFIPILKNVLALTSIPMYKCLSWYYKQSFAITANEDNLKTVHAQNLSVEIEQSSQFICYVTVIATGNADITISTTIENEQTGLYYFPRYDQNVESGSNTIEIISDGYGSEYNLSESDTLKINEQIEFVSSECEVDTIIQYAQDQEDTEDLRRRIINEQSSSSGGSNSADYRRWGEAVTGVYRVFPFSGRPLLIGSAKPGDITVYVESDQILGLDGVADSSLLASVESEILTDPETGESRPSLGNTSETLFVESIVIVTFNITINDIVIDEEKQQVFESKTDTEIDTYLRTIAPYCFGIDPEWSRNDNVSSVTVSNKINELLKTYGATASSISVTEVGVGVVTNRIMIGGEVARIGIVTFDYEE